MSRQQACPVGHLGPPVKQLGGVPDVCRAHAGVGFSTGQIISWAENKQNIAHCTLKITSGRKFKSLYTKLKSL